MRRFSSFGLAGAVGEPALDRVDLGRVEGRAQAQVLHDQLVGDGHQLAELLVRRLGDAHPVVQGLGHLADAVEPLEQRHGEDHLRVRCRRRAAPRGPSAG